MKEFLIEANDAEQRMDKFLKKILPNATLGNIYKLLRVKKISVNKKKVEPDYRLIEGDIVRIFLSDDQFGEITKKIVSTPSQAATNNKIDIAALTLFEDADILIVNKPPHINVHPGDHKTTELSLIQVVQDYLWNAHDSLSFRPSLVHRIDRDTSGALMIAKSKAALSALGEDIKTKKIEKIYLAVCVGKPKEKVGEIRAKILRKEVAMRENKMTIDEKNGQTALTKYCVLQEGIENNYSLVACKIETGRMHQIRLHLNHIGVPILGDETYGDKKANRDMTQSGKILRQCLHAYILKFKHPLTKKSVTVVAPLPSDMKNLFDSEHVSLDPQSILVSLTGHS